MTKLKGESQHNILLTIGETMEIQVTKPDGTVVIIRMETIARHLTKELEKIYYLSYSEIPESELFNVIYESLEDLIDKGKTT